MQDRTVYHVPKPKGHRAAWDEIDWGIVIGIRIIAPPILLWDLWNLVKFGVNKLVNKVAGDDVRSLVLPATRSLLKILEEIEKTKELTEEQKKLKKEEEEARDAFEEANRYMLQRIEGLQTWSKDLDAECLTIKTHGGGR